MANGSWFKRRNSQKIAQRAVKRDSMKEKMRLLHLEADRIHADLVRALLVEDGIGIGLSLVATGEFCRHPRWVADRPDPGRINTAGVRLAGLC